MEEKKEGLTALIGLGFIERSAVCVCVREYVFFSSFVCVSGGAVAAWLPGSND